MEEPILLLLGKDQFMIDRKKYLYWVNKDDPNFPREVVWREMYSRFGFAFHLVQMVEYNIANILSIEEFEKKVKHELTVSDVDHVRKIVNERYKELSKMTFGQLKNEVKKSDLLQQIDLSALQNIVEYRNWLAHHCFKEQFLDQQAVSLEQVDSFIDELNDYEVTLKELNDWLVAVFKDNKIKMLLLKVPVA